MPGGKCIFQKLWLQRPDCKTWLEKEDNHTARCTLCKKTFSIANMGVSALTAHAKGSKHKATVGIIDKGTNSIQNFLSPSSSSVSAKEDVTPIATSSTRAASATVQQFVTKEETMKAEIIWNLKLNDEHWSYNSCSNIGDVFKAMFPDSEIAQKFQCGERKSSYLTTFGLAPHFKNLLGHRIRERSDGFVLLFDESLNNKNQKKQLDVHVRLWDNDTIVSRYYNSEFMGHATAEDLLRVFDNSTEGLNRKGILQVSMDGPSVNWKFYNMLQKELERDCSTSLLNVGSCGLHIVHGAYKKGIETTDWNLCSILYGMHTLFKNTPARREDFCKLLGDKNPLMPLKFCKTRWVENVNVLERTLVILPDMKVYVKAVEKKKVPNPDTKSFETVKQACSDPLFPAKLQFAISVARQIEPFLVKYQSDKPMLPFLVSDLHQVLKTIMERFVQSDTMKTLKTKEELARVDISDKSLHRPYKSIDVGFCADKTIKELKDKVSERQILEFKMESKACLQAIVQKILEKAPIKYSLARNLACLDPHYMATDADSCRRRFKGVLTSLVEANRVQESDCDTLMNQYSQFIGEDVPKDISAFRTFDPDTDRLDTFLYGKLCQKMAFSKLWNVIRLVLLLSHGQASVERGFSVNRQIEVENLSEKGYIAQRLITDHIRAVGGIHNVELDKLLLSSVAAARQKYFTYLDDQKKQKEKETASKKRKIMEEELDSLKAKKKRCLLDISALDKTADEFAIAAETKGDLTLLSKSNGLRAKSKTKKEELSKLEELITCETKKMKSF